ncbi:hypothetical protein D3C81_1885060 [compost metagenome]
MHHLHVFDRRNQSRASHDLLGLFGHHPLHECPRRFLMLGAVEQDKVFATDHGCPAAYIGRKLSDNSVLQQLFVRPFGVDLMEPVPFIDHEQLAVQQTFPRARPYRIQDGGTHDPVVV